MSTQHYADDFERFAHDIINVVLNQGSRSGSAPKWQIEKIAKMLRTGPGVTIWPRDAAEAAQRARDKVRVPVLVLPPKPVVVMPPLVVKFPGQ